MYRVKVARNLSRISRNQVGCVGGIVSVIAPRFASTGIEKKSTGGIFSWLTGEKYSALPPLDTPLPTVSIPPYLPDYVEPGKTVVTKLENSATIASEFSTNPSCSVGLFIDSGSVYESPRTSGITHLLEKMAFKSTTNRSHLRIVREIEAIGGNVSASASREVMAYTFDALKTYLPQMVEVLVDCVRNPAFLDWEVKDELQKLKMEIDEASRNPQGLIMEALHSAGFRGALSYPLMASEGSVNSLNSSDLEDFTKLNYTAPRIVIAASGVDHDELLPYAEPLLSDLPLVSRPEEPNSVYGGGEYRCHAESENTHVALAFEVPGGWRNEEETMIASVLQILMGGGGSFSTGGPGKGMYSRLYLNVLCNFHEVESFSAFSSVYNNTGIFGIHATAGHDFIAKAVDLAVSELLAVATPGKVTPAQLNRAKASTKSEILMNLESRVIVADDIGRQILTSGERKPIEHFLKALDEVSLDDITKYANKLISSPLTMASWGNIGNVPRYDTVQTKFRA
ncbi:Mitochondrial-processing peptidase subunit alpha [Zostera marina]|uniref:Mitochondrial-processing peptidase subunit alpha n=1 Tax=Zostera marina TaxID=29655 RepID=A0A0K9Q3E4_ZOSMR|nr:Mitochondrial-processing peptidase subunit alpha [Zostera marina]